MKIFVFISILALMGTQSVYGKDTEAGGAESQKSLVQNINTSDYSLKANESLKKPIKKWRYMTGGVLATYPALLYLTTLSIFGLDFDPDAHKALFYITIPGLYGIPRVVQGRYWPMGLVFTAIQGVAGLTLYIAHMKPIVHKTSHGGKYGLSLAPINFTLELTLTSVLIASAIWQAVDAWILSDSYELAEKSSWGITPTYSYNPDTNSNAYGLALQYMW